MPTLIGSPSRIQAAGNKPKLIEEYIGRVNTRHEGVSVARMTSPPGWEEPGQTPEFEEYTLVLKGMLRVDYRGGHLEVGPGQAVIAHPCEWVRYSSPGPEGRSIWPSASPRFHHSPCTATTLTGA